MLTYSMNSFQKAPYHVLTKVHMNVTAEQVDKPQVEAFWTVKI